MVQEENHAVIPSQCAHWRGNLPVRKKIILKIFQKSYGIATPACGLVRNDLLFDSLRLPFQGSWHGVSRD